MLCCAGLAAKGLLAAAIAISGLAYVIYKNWDWVVKQIKDFAAVLKAVWATISGSFSAVFEKIGKKSEMGALSIPTPQLGAPSSSATPAPAAQSAAARATGPWSGLLRIHIDKEDRARVDALETNSRDLDLEVDTGMIMVGT